MSWRFNPPPGWPVPPEDWSPPPDWKPPPDWPPPPPDWSFWIRATPAPESATPESAHGEPAPGRPAPGGAERSQRPSCGPSHPEREGTASLASALSELATVLHADQPPPADALAALGTLTGLRDDLDQMEQHLISAARDRGVSWQEVAGALGLRSRQAAEQRWLRLRAANTRDPAAERRRRQRQRDIDSAAGEPVGTLRAQVALLHHRLAHQRDWDDHAAPAGLARQTLAAALDAPPGGLYDLARLAVADLHTIPPPVLGGALAETLDRVSALLQSKLT